jgi:very-short-patch-repair endonuclease
MAQEPEHVRRARELRRKLTPAEVILWRELRGRRFSNYKFRRQRPIGSFIADFYCHEAKLIVELDGQTHIGREDYDGRRQSELQGWGLKVLRFWNTAVYDDLECVLEAIFDECYRRAPKKPPP